MKEFIPGQECLVLSRNQVRAFDAWAINEIGIPGVVLMENAGRSCAELVMRRLAAVERPKVCIVCGTGNNGGDGYVAARHLLNSGFAATVVLCGSRDKVGGDAKTNLDVLERLGGQVVQLNVEADDVADQIARLGSDADMVVDGLFGTGLSGPVKGGYAVLIEAINALGRPVLAIDIPSGLDCDAGEVLGVAVKAAYTVTFAAVKKGFTAPAAGEYTGRIYVAGIGAEPGHR